MNVWIQLLLCVLCTGYARGASLLIPANGGYGWTPYFPGSRQCVTALANTTIVSNLTMAVGASFKHLWDSRRGSIWVGERACK